MANPVLARQKRQARRVAASLAVVALLLAFAGLWAPVANTYQTQADGSAVSTHRFGMLGWAELSWTGPNGEFFWPVERLRPQIVWSRVLLSVFATLVLATPLLWFEPRVMRRGGHTWLALHRRR